jgi:hypothetical protein
MKSSLRTPGSRSVLEYGMFVTYLINAGSLRAMFFFVSIIFVLQSCGVNATQGCSDADVINQALCALTSAVDIAAFYAEWKCSVASEVYSDPCGWRGVSCSGSDITAISFASLPVQGTFPADVGVLTTLQSLDLSSGSFSGQLPASIGCLTGLTAFVLNGNQFTGRCYSIICPFTSRFIYMTHLVPLRLPYIQFCL